MVKVTNKIPGDLRVSAAAPSFVMFSPVMSLGKLQASWYASICFRFSYKPSVD